MNRPKNPYTNLPVGSDESLTKSCDNLVREIEDNWLPNINERRANPLIRAADLMRCALAISIVPLALEKCDDDRVREKLTHTNEVIKRYQEALLVEPGKAQA